MSVSSNQAWEGYLNEHGCVPMLLWCPECDAQHVDWNEWSTKPHRTHLCHECGHLWRPFEYATVGILPWFSSVASLRRILVIHLIARAFKLAGIFLPDHFVRAGGDCVCQSCGKLYRQHPIIETENWLHLLCDGTRVKL